MLPFVISGLITWAATYLDRFIIQSKLGSQDLGLYAATLQIASFPSNFFSSIMSQLFVPRIYLSETGGLSNVEIVTSFRRQVFRASIFICPFLVIFIFLGEEIVTILSSSEYFIDRLSFAITVFGSLFLQIGNVLGAEGMLYKNVGAYLFPKIVHVAVVYFALNFLTGHFKVYGAFLSVLFSGFSFFILIVITNQNLTYRIKN
jgi:O-antigen/teichoic acid export membrane protein